MNDSEIARIVGENIRMQRVRQGWTQGQLAARLHVTRSAVANWEGGLGGNRGISLTNFYRVCAEFDIACPLFVEATIDDFRKFGNTDMRPVFRSLAARGKGLVFRRRRPRLVKGGSDG